MTIAAATYGGAVKHCALATENPIPSRRMIGRKYAIEYEHVVVIM
jgi:hypothetical protein